MMPADEELRMRRRLLIDGLLASGLYGAQVQKFVTLIRSAPGRESYDVSVAEAPAPALG